METTDTSTLQRLLELDRPVWRLDTTRTITHLNALMAWLFTGGPLGPDWAPDRFLGRHVYAVIATAIETGFLSPNERENELYFLYRLSAVWGTDDEHHPSVRRFKAALFAASHRDEAWWRNLYGTWGEHGRGSGFDPRHYVMLFSHPDNRRFRFVVEIRYEENGARTVIYTPDDRLTQDVFRHLYEVATRPAASLPYVVSCDILTENLHASAMNQFPVLGPMSKEHDQREEHHSDPPIRWYAIEEAASWPVDTVFSRRVAAPIDHLHDGPGYGWEFSAGVEGSTQFEIFPARHLAKLRFVNGASEWQQREYVLDHLGIERAEAGESVLVFSARNRRESLLRVHASGEFEEQFRFLPPTAKPHPPQTVFGQRDVSAREAPLQLPPEITVDEAMAHLGVGRSAVTRLTRSGRLRARREGRRLMVSSEDVLNYRRGKPGRRSQDEQ